MLTKGKTVLGFKYPLLDGASIALASFRILINKEMKKESMSR
jgi:hypothetical protein